MIRLPSLTIVDFPAGQTAYDPALGRIVILALNAP